MSSTIKENPLAGHFRTPALHLTLPSHGKYYPNNDIDMPDSGEIAIFPMTAKDEIALNTPDALMSGSATIEVIQSCVPSIKNANSIPTIDIDAILVAIRIATFGENLDFTNQCPKCDETNDYEIDLRSVLDQYNYIDFTAPQVVGDLTIFFKPQLFKDLNKVSILAFEEQRVMNVVENDALDSEVRKSKFTEYLKSTSEAAVNVTSNFIERIVLADGTEVQARGYINEFITNCDKFTYDAIDKCIDTYRDQAETKPVSLHCPHCNHDYQSPLAFEASNFFG